MNTRTTLILALCLVAVASYLVFVAKPWAEPEAAPTPAGPQDMWADKPSVDDITRLEVASTRHAPRVFAREGDQWRLAEPIAARAQKWAVEDMVRSVIDLKADRQYAMNDKNRPANETTHLDAPVYTVTLVTKDDKVLTLKIGARTPTGGDTYVQKDKDETILVAGENLHTKFDKKLRDLRDKRVTEFKIEEATRVKVEGMQNYELVKVDDTWRVESPVRCRADKAKVEAMLRAASSLSAEEFITDEPPSLQPYQLDPPRLNVTVTIETKVETPDKIEEQEREKEEGEEEEAKTEPAPAEPTPEPRTVVLQLGGATDTQANHYFAKLGSEEPVFTISKSTFDNASPALSEIRDKAVAAVELPKCKKVELVLPAQQATFTKEGNRWTYADGTPAERARIEELLRAVGNLRAIRFEDADSLIGVSTAEPRATITITQEGQAAPVTLRVLGTTPSERNAYCMTNDDNSIAIVAEESVATFLAEPITYRDRGMATLNQAHVKQLEIEQNAQTVTLTKTGNIWSMIAPVAAKADAGAVRTLIGDLTALRAKRVVGQGNAAEFGFNQPDLKLAVTVQAPPPSTQPEAPDAPGVEGLRQAWLEEHPGEPLPEYLAEEPATTAPATQATTQATTQPAPPPPPQTHRFVFVRRADKAYGMVEGRDLVYELDTKIYDDLAAELHDRTVVHYKADDATGLSVIRGDEALDLVKTDVGWSYRQDKTVALDAQKISEAIDALQDTQTHRFVRYETTAADLATYKLDAPALKVAVTIGTERIELAIAAEGPAGDADKSRYATASGSTAVFLLKPEQIEKIDKTLSDFEKGGESTATPAPPRMPPGMP